jgi:hypothetical protein
MLNDYQIRRFSTMSKAQLLTELWVLQNAIDNPKAQVVPSKELPDAVQVEEFADDNGHLKDQDISEDVFCQTLSRLTKLDIRAVDQVPRELGLFTIQVWYKTSRNMGTMETALCKVWMIPVKEDDDSFGL